MRRLKNETDEMKERFAILTERTLSSLKKHKVSMGELKALLKQLNAPKKSKLSNKLKKITDISKAFEVLHSFWSFFDYEILGVIIRKFCFDIDFEEYVSNIVIAKYVKCQMIPIAQNCPNQKRKGNYTSRSLSTN